MPFKAKLRKIGNSIGVILPKDVITGLGVGDEIELNVITKDSTTTDVITPEKTAYKPTGICIYCRLPTDQPSPQCDRH